MRKFLMAATATALLGVGAALPAAPARHGAEARGTAGILVAAAEGSGADLRRTDRTKISEAEGADADVRSNRHLA